MLRETRDYEYVRFEKEKDFDNPFGKRVVEKEKERFIKEWSSELIEEDAFQILDIVGFSDDVKFEWSGFYSQGDGARIIGTWQKPEYSVEEKLKEWAPKDKRLHEIGREIDEIECEYLEIVPDMTNHLYVHSGTMMCGEYECESEAEACNAVGVFSELASYFYDRLQEDYEWYFEDENIKRLIIDGEYWYDAYGNRYYEPEDIYIPLENK